MKTRSAKVALVFLSLLLLSSGRTINNSNRRKRLRHQTKNQPSSREDAEEATVPILADGTSSSPTSSYELSAKGKKSGKKSEEKSAKESTKTNTSHSDPVNTESPFRKGRGNGGGQKIDDDEEDHDHDHDSDVEDANESYSSSKKGTKKSKKESKKFKKDSKESKKSKTSSSLKSSKKSKKHSKKEKKYKDSSDRTPEDDLDVPFPSQSPSSMPTSGLFPTKLPTTENLTPEPTNDEGTDLSDGPVAFPTPTRSPRTGAPTVTRAPTTSGTALPTIEPAITRTSSPTRLMPTAAPTAQISPPRELTTNPTIASTTGESQAPSGHPSETPTSAPSSLHSSAPTGVTSESAQPSLQPSVAPSVASSEERTAVPTGTLSSEVPSAIPTTTGDSTDSDQPSAVPTSDSTLEDRTATPTSDSTESDSPSAVPTSDSFSDSDAPSAVPTSGASSNQASSASPTVGATGENREEGSFETALNLDEVPENYHQIFIDAAAKWDKVIVGDLEDYVVREAELATPGLRCDPASIPSIVDDVFICASLPEIDGPAGILGSAGPTFARFGEFVQTSVGYMQFDLADVEILEQKGQLAGTILHEMAHVYGIGTLWLENLLVEDTDSCPYKYDSRASEEYRALSGCDGPVPVEADGAKGTKCLHWDEDCFQSELMTGVNSGGLELSRISIASLEDLGYTVDYSQAAPFPVDLLNPSCVCSTNANLKDGITRVQRSTESEASKAARQNALNYGQAKLKSARSAMANVTSRDTDRIYLGDRVIVVLYWADEQVQSVLVTAS